MQEIYRQPTRKPVPRDIYGFFINIENKLMAFQHLRTLLATKIHLLTLLFVITIP